MSESNELVNIKIYEGAKTEDGTTVVRNENVSYDVAKEIRIISDTDGQKRLPSKGKEITISGAEITVSVGRNPDYRQKVELEIGCEQTIRLNSRTEV